MAKKERVLVLGGGFGGVKAALELSDDDRFDVTLLSDTDELRYYPTLYLHAIGTKRSNSSMSLSELFQGRKIHIVKNTAKTLDRKAKQIIAEDGGIYPYDTLVISLGVVTNYFGIDGLQEYSYSIKSQEEAMRFKKHLHKQLLDDKRPDFNYVIVGAGPTGIELAGALPKYIKTIMKNHGVRDRKIHIDLIEAAPRLLPRLPKHTSNKVRRRLKRLGVKLYLGKTVQGQTADKLMVSGKPIRSHTVIWTAGVTNHPFFSENHFVLMGRGKVAVDTYLQTEPDIFVIGDNANTPYSGMAQTALYDGAVVAHNLQRRADGKDFKSYIARKPVTVIPVGPRWATVLWGKYRLNGKLGWLVREAADVVGFHDFESWTKATKRWYSQYTVDDDCDTCAIANQ